MTSDGAQSAPTSISNLQDLQQNQRHEIIPCCTVQPYSPHDNIDGSSSCNGCTKSKGPSVCSKLSSFTDHRTAGLPILFRNRTHRLHVKSLPQDPRTQEESLECLSTGGVRRSSTRSVCTKESVFFLSLLLLQADLFRSSSSRQVSPVRKRSLASSVSNFGQIDPKIDREDLRSSTEFDISTSVIHGIVSAR